MKKKVVLILAAAMMLTLAACGEKAETPDPAQTNETVKTDDSIQTEDTVAQVSPDSYANGDGSYRFLYGWDHHEVTLYTPEGAVSEGTGVYDPEYVPQENVILGNTLSFGAEDESWYCMARDWQSNSVNYISHPALYYFNGELDEEGKAEYPEYSQTVTDLGFQWIDLPVKMIVSDYTDNWGIDWTETFVGVEFDNKAAPDGGKGLLGLDFFHDRELTRDQLAYIAGRIFGVDSGITGDPFAESESGTESEASIDASAIIGSWLDPESTWGTCFTFNADGTGARSTTVDGASKPFTYKVEGDRITVVYDGGEEAWYTVEPGAGTLTITDQFDNTAVYEAYKESAENGTAAGSGESDGVTNADLTGKWLDEEAGNNESYTFNADGTGIYTWKDETYAFDYDIYDNGETLIIRYEDGDRSTFAVRVDGDQLILDRDWILLRQ